MAGDVPWLGGRAARPPVDNSGGEPAALRVSLSIVVPSHNEGGNLPALHRAVAATLAAERTDFELIIVDDSTDETWSVIRDLTRQDGRVRGIRFTRRFGQQAALLAGMSAARGDAVITMDADLQHPPEVIPSLLREWRRGFKVVETARDDSRAAGVVQRTASRWFYRVFAFATGVPLRPSAGDFRLLDRAVVDELMRLDEGEYFIRALVAWLGYPSAVVEYSAARRLAGTTSYSWLRRIRLASSGIVSFSVIPLRVGIAIGLFTAAAAFAELAYAIVMKLRGETVPGWASLIAVIAFLFGVQFVLIGLLGAYLGRVHLASKRRPLYVVAETVEAEPKSSRIASDSETSPHFDIAHLSP